MSTNLENDIFCVLGDILAQQGFLIMRQKSQTIASS